MTTIKSFTVNLPVDKRGYVSEVTRDVSFKKIKTRSENRFCIDCKKSSPSWVSVTYGTFICLTCSGSHRRMGTHISFVRSTELDNFTRKELARIDLGGNSRFMQFMKSHGFYTDNIDYQSKVVALYKIHLDNLVDEEFNVENDETKNKISNVSVDAEFLPIDIKNHLSNERLLLEQPLDNRDSIKETNLTTAVAMAIEKKAEPLHKPFYMLKPNARKTKCDNNNNKAIIMQETLTACRAKRLEDNFDFFSLEKKASVFFVTDMNSTQIMKLESNSLNDSKSNGMPKCAQESWIPTRLSNTKSISSKNVISNNEMTRPLSDSDSHIAHNLQFYRNSKAISSSMILQNQPPNHDLIYDRSLISNEGLDSHYQYSNSMYNNTYNSARQISTGVHEWEKLNHGFRNLLMKI
ncbi:uncharacterized protein LOC128884021 isoform X2 [Hylaeus volcanicus]|uniref:uncharacterized protein LOC128884021 isoform X2 n=1 Tax=Hylaeus volcanicus TaxID=313075 RepID=UPI0023B79C09|nr:uncharacterized protein LOC128884021 isoform X2 [Hylaeus volcanicus]